jgi:hypothetical protein
MAKPLWIEQAHSVPIQDVIEEVGLQSIGRRGWGPCPHCGAEVRSNSEHKKRGAVEVIGDNGWLCIKCETTGDSINLVSFSLYSARLKDLPRENQWAVREWFAVRKWCDPYEQKPRGPFDGFNGVPQRRKPAPKPPPPKEVSDLWDACLPVNQDGGFHPGGMDMDVAKFLSERRWSPMDLAALDLARLTPHPDTYTWPDWWPKGRAGLWRLVVRAYTPEGIPASLHGRAIKPVPKKDNGKDKFPKVLWPKDKSASGLVMADAQGLQMLRREDRPRVILVCEGITDMISASLYKGRFGKKVAILSCTSGAFRGLSRVYWPRWVPTYAASDGDDKGDKYADEITTALCPRPVRRLNLRDL